MNHEAGFAPVAEAVKRQGGPDIRWNRDAAADAQVREAVAAMLADGLGCEEAVQIALLNNAGLQAEYEELGVTQAEAVQAGLLSNPVFSGFVRWPTKGAGTNVEVEAAQDFLQILMLPARRRLAEGQFAAAQARAAATVLGHAAEVRAAYRDAQAAEAVARLKGLIGDAAGLNLEFFKRLHAAGNMSDLDLAKAADQRATAAVEELTAQARRAEARERLTVLMGLWGEQAGWALAEKLPDVAQPTEDELRGLESRAMGNRLELAAARKSADAAALALGTAVDWRWLGTAEVGVNAEREPDKTWLVGPTFSLTLPLLDQGEANVEKHRALLRQSLRRVEAMAVDIRSEVRLARARMVNAAQAAAQHRRVVIPLRERQVRLAQENYNFMLKGLPELLAAKTAEYEAYEGYILAVADYWKARAALSRAVGGGLADPPGPPADVPAASAAAPMAHAHHH